MRAPLAPPRLSLSRNVEADAHAVVTSSEMLRPDSMIFALSAATSASLSVGAGWDRVLPDQLLVGDLRAEVPHGGPMSRWSSLNQARANASASSSGCSWKCREIGS